MILLWLHMRTLLSKNGRQQRLHTADTPIHTSFWELHASSISDFVLVGRWPTSIKYEGWQRPLSEMFCIHLKAERRETTCICPWKSSRNCCVMDGRGYLVRLVYSSQDGHKPQIKSHGPLSEVYYGTNIKHYINIYFAVNTVVTQIVKTPKLNVICHWGSFLLPQVLRPWRPTVPRSVSWYTGTSLRVYWTSPHVSILPSPFFFFGSCVKS